MLSQSHDSKARGPDPDEDVSMPADFDAAFSLFVADLMGGSAPSAAGSPELLKAHLPNQQPATANPSSAQFLQPLLNEQESTAFSEFLENMLEDPNFLFDPKLAEGLPQFPDLETEDTDQGLDFSLTDTSAPPTSQSSATNGSFTGSSQHPTPGYVLVEQHKQQMAQNSGDMINMRTMDVYPQVPAHDGLQNHHHIQQDLGHQGHPMFQHQQLQQQPQLPQQQYRPDPVKLEPEFAQQPHQPPHPPHQSPQLLHHDSQSQHQPPHLPKAEPDYEEKHVGLATLLNLPLPRDTNLNEQLLQVPHDSGEPPKLLYPEMLSQQVANIPEPRESHDSESSSPAAARRKRELLTEEQKRLNHISKEKKRRDAIKNTFDELCSLVPPPVEPEPRQSRQSRPSKSKSETLSAVYDYLKLLLDQNQALRSILASKGVNTSGIPHAAHPR